MTVDPRLAYAINRRRFLALLGSAGVAGVVGCASSSTPQPPSASAGRERAEPTEVADGSAGEQAAPEPPHRPPNGERRLVVIEMQGGNDGLSMLQPYDSGVLQTKRPGLTTPDDELVDAGSGFGWHPSLAGLADLGMAAVLGVGSPDPSFSHFEMEQRWWRGDSGDLSRLGTGFFGRVCDQLDVGDPVTGLSLSGGPSAALLSEKAVTVGLADPGASWFFRQEEAWYEMLCDTLGAMSAPSSPDNASFTAAATGLRNTLRFAESLAEIPEGDEDRYPWSELGQQLRFGAEVLSLDVGVRVIHVRQSGYDTHSGQHWRHAGLMGECNDAVVAFINDLDDRGQFDDTLVVTTSEFGRRVDENDAGTDHGGASAMLVCGGGARGVHGVAPSLTELDDGNAMATARFEDYYATIAEDWFGVPSSEVLPAGDVIAGLL